MRKLAAGISVVPALLGLLAGNRSEALAQTNGTAGAAVPFQTGAVQGNSITNPATATTNGAARARRGRGGRTQGPPTLGLDQGFLDPDTPEFDLRLVKASQTIAALKPKGAGDFDFTPADQLNARAGNHYYHLGDITFRARTGNLAGDGAWTGYSTAAERKPVTDLGASGGMLASADLSPTLPDDCPLQVTRNWRLDDGKLVLEFVLKNKTLNSMVIGSLGIPLVFNNYITGRTLSQAHEICSFSDPAINEDGGYVQVTRLSGHGPALVVVPEGKTPLEAYNPILNEAPSASTRVFTDLTPRAQTFEGFYEWLVHSKAYADNEWKRAQEWNPATSETLAPGETRTIGLKFLVSPEIRDIEKTLAANRRPVAVGIPGYIVPMGMDAKLFLNYPEKVVSIMSDPEGAVEAVSQTGDEGRMADIRCAWNKMGPRADDGELRGRNDADDPVLRHQTGG